MRIIKGDIFVHKGSGEWFAAIENGSAGNHCINVAITRPITDEEVRRDRIYADILDVLGKKSVSGDGSPYGAGIYNAGISHGLN